MTFGLVGDAGAPKLKRPFFGAAICPAQGTGRLGMAARAGQHARGDALLPRSPAPHPRRHHRCMLQECERLERSAPCWLAHAGTTRHTRRPRGSTGLLDSWGAALNAHHGDLGGPRHADALHARNGRGRRERRRKAARNERGRASAHKPELDAKGGAGSWRCSVPNDGEDRKHGYLRERAGRELSSKASWSGKPG